MKVHTNRGCHAIKLPDAPKAFRPIPNDSEQGIIPRRASKLGAGHTNDADGVADLRYLAHGQVSLARAEEVLPRRRRVARVIELFPVNEIAVRMCGGTGSSIR